MSEIESKLTSIFQLVIDWVKFAEAKNAGLVVVAGAGAAASLSYLAVSTVSMGWKRALFTSVFFFIVSALTSLLSFLPRVNLSRLLEKKRRKALLSDTDNLYFFGHLCKYNPEELAGTLVRLYFPALNSPFKPTKEQLDIAAQIIVNSRIAVYKLRVFSFALWSAVIAIVIILIGFLFRVSI